MQTSEKNPTKATDFLRRRLAALTAITLLPPAPGVFTYPTKPCSVSSGPALDPDWEARR